MARIPAVVGTDQLSAELSDGGMELIHQGKVRDTFRIPGTTDLRFVFTTDRISVFNYVLPVSVTCKGSVLNALSFYFRKELLKEFSSDLVVCGTAMDEYLPVAFRGNRTAQMCGMIVKDADMILVEAVPRECLTGTGYKRYKTHGDLWGIPLPEELFDGAMLPKPCFTVTRKSENDEPIMHDDFLQEFGELGREIARISMLMFRYVRQFANARSFMYADTKFEFGLTTDGKLVLCDEVLTPDSSRIWSILEWQEAQRRGRPPAGWDKQPVRDYFADFFEKLTGTREEKLAQVADLVVPPGLVSQISDRYMEILERFTGRNLGEFGRTCLGIK